MAALKIIFLGSGSAFTAGNGNYQSNLLLQMGDDTLLVDAGGDIRFSLLAAGFTHVDIKNIYISHLHNDHIGGLEYLALTTYFDPNCNIRPNLFSSEKVIKDLWKHSLSGGLRTIQTKLATLDTYFEVHPVKQYETFQWAGIQFKLVQTVHIVSEYELMPSYGLMFDVNSTRIFFTSDTQFAPNQLFDYYKEADIIFHDCETTPVKSSVHAHYTELAQIPQEFKKKMWLYHYNPGTLPDAISDGFPGFVKRGQIFEF